MKKTTLFKLFTTNLLASLLLVGIGLTFRSLPAGATASKITQPTYSITQTLELNSSNTPLNISNTVKWNELDFYATPSRYTEFHYKYVTTTIDSHVSLANYGLGGLIQNRDALIYTDKIIEFRISVSSWSQIQFKTSDNYSENLDNYTLDAVYTLSGATVQTINLFLNAPYFSLCKVDGASINLEYLKITYTC